MANPSKFLVGGNANAQVHLNLAMGNRHGLIAGATGTGKTVTLQIMAEGFARAGVPVFMADIKGDLSGLAQAAKPHAKISERIKKIDIEDYQSRAFPCVFWDLYGKQGHRVRTTISDFGPLLLANFLELNETQTAVLYAAFSIADEQGLLMLDVKDLQAVLNWMKKERTNLQDEYGGLSVASIGAIQRRLMMLEQQGGNEFFGEPALDLNHLLQTTLEGHGVINILDATSLIHQPRIALQKSVKAQGELTSKGGLCRVIRSKKSKKEAVVGAHIQAEARYIKQVVKKGLIAYHHKNKKIIDDTHQEAAVINSVRKLLNTDTFNQLYGRGYR